MRPLVWIVLIGSACSYDPSRVGGGDDDGGGPYVLPEPELIPGGGVHDGPIVAGLNVVVIDGETNAPIEGAMVTVGAFQGVTDANGVFVASDASLAGKQTVLASAVGYRTSQWIGVDGANVTIALEPPVPRAGSAVGTITNFGTFQIAGGGNHSRRGRVQYSQDDRATTTANNLDTPNDGDECVGSTCSYRVLAREGTVSLMAAIVDRDSKGTGDPRDDTEQLLGWAFKANVPITAGTDTTNQDLVPFAAGDLNSVTITYGSLPAGATFALALVAIEVSPTESIPLPALIFDDVTAPKLSAIPGATSYRLTALAIDRDFSSFSATIQRGVTGTALAASSFIEFPPNVVATTTDTAFGSVTGANIYRVIYRDENIDTDLFEAVIFDDTTSVTLPAGITVPSGNLDVTVEAIGSTIDVTNFGFDADATNIDHAAFRTIDVN